MGPLRHGRFARVGAALALACAPIASGCAPAARTSAQAPNAHAAAATTPASRSAEWIAAEKPDLRRLTVVVAVQPPRELIAQYKELGGRYPKLQRFFEAAAEGGFGSGFVVVHRTPAGPRPFVVTNRHVVDLASEATIEVEGAPDALRAKVVFVDPTYDVAILAPHSTAGGDHWPFQAGFGFDAMPAKDQQTVVASGYPGIAGEPSYQVTRGYVSNERFELTEAGRKLLYVQHTAPIDLGSSGGPLTSTEGKLLGVNTMKVRERENVALAVPASVVLETLAKAEALDAAPPTKRPAPEQACAELLAQVVEGEEKLALVERSIASSMVAREGFNSMEALLEDRDALMESFVEDPTAALLRAVVLRLIDDVGGAKGRAAASCTAVPSPNAALVPVFAIHTPRGERAWAFRWEQGRWKLDRAMFGRVAEAAPKKKPSKPGPRKKASAPAHK